MKLSKRALGFGVPILMLMVSCGTGQLQESNPTKILPNSFGVTQSDSVASVDSVVWQFMVKDTALKQLIDSALVRNFDLRIAHENIAAANAASKAARLNWLPDLQFGTNSSIRKFGDYTMDGVGNYDTKFSTNINEKQRIPNPLPDYYFGFQTTWEIDIWRKLSYRRKSVFNQWLSQVASRKYLQTQVITNVATQYYEWLALNNELEILRDNIELQQSAYDMVLKQKETGRANELAVELLKAQLLSSKTMEVEIREKRQICRAAITMLSGAMPYELSIDTTFNTKSNGKLPLGVPSQLLAHRADIKQAEFDLIAAKADVNAARAAFYPSLTITGNMGLQAFNSALLLETPASLAYQALGGLAQPLFMRKKLKAELLMAKANKRKAYINYEKAIVNAFTEVYTAMKSIRNASDMVHFKQQEMQTLKQSVHTVGELFAAGRATYLEVVTVQKNVLQAQVDLVEYEKRERMARVNLYRALGGGW